MKKILIVVLVLMGLLTLAGAAMAEDTKNFDVYLDYSQLENGDEDLKSNFVTIGGNYSYHHLLFGAMYSDAVSFKPDQPGASVNILMAYAGYNFLESDTNVLGIIGGYGVINDNEGMGDMDISSFLIGFRGAYRQDAWNMSFTYLYGFRNKLEVGNSETTDLDLSFLELTGGYDFTDNFGIYMTYRSNMMELQNADGDNSGFGLGARFRF